MTTADPHILEYLDRYLSACPLGITLAFGVITVLHMTVGERAPKMWALRRAKGMTLANRPTLRLVGLTADLGHALAGPAQTAQ